MNLSPHFWHYPERVQRSFFAAPNVQISTTYSIIWMAQKCQRKETFRVEAARIARGNVLDVTEVNVDDIDALFIPGGFGAAKTSARSHSMEQMQASRKISKG